MISLFNPHNHRWSPTGSVHREAGQVLVMMGVAAIALIATMGLAIDIGRLYVARAELSRAVDAAALAGVVELPDIDAVADKARAYLAENEPNAEPEITPHPEQNSVTVKATKTLSLLFLPLVGIETVSVSAHAKAGFATQTMDVYMTLDATGSMHNGCNENEDNPGGACPIYEAKQAAKTFAETLLRGTSGNVAIGAGAFRGCHNPPRNNTRCIDVSGAGSQITTLTTNLNAVLAGIDNIHAIGGPGQPTGGSGTNICLALKKAQEVIFGPGSHTQPDTKRYVILLTDGDNVYNAGQVYQSNPQSPESPCRPSNPSVSDNDVSPDCRSASNTTQAQKVDRLSHDMANTLKAQGVEIFVIGLSPCAHDPSALCNTRTIGTRQSDAQRNENLMKCIASSTAGTNDHYFWAESADDLPEVFGHIARQIAHRLLE